MLFNDFSFRKLIRSLHVGAGDETPSFIELEKELDDLRKFSLALLMAFLTIHEISASTALGAATLALLVYTISLHITTNARFLGNSPTISRFLHTIPLLGIFSMIIFKFVIIVRSPAIAVMSILACTLPTFMMAVRPVRRFVESFAMPDPVSTIPGAGSLTNTHLN